MKQAFLNYSMNKIINFYPKYSDEKLAELKFGLEGFYIMFSKTIIIFSLALLLGIFKEMLLLLLFFNILRITGFGLHATTSLKCLLSSSSIFIGLPYVSKLIVFPFFIKLFLGLLAIFLIFKYSPADTAKRPLVNAKKRKLYKIITTINCFILVLSFIFIKNQIISNLIIFGIYIEIFLIHPYVYKIFHLSYDNYLNFHFN